MIAVAEKVSKLSLKPQTSLLLNEVGSFFSSSGIEAYIVGGFLRDLLLGRETADIDLAITADALKIAPRMASALGGRHIPLDKENRVSRLLLARGTPPARPKWQIDLSTITGSIEQDLKRRDFTINALAADLKEHTRAVEVAIAGEVKVPNASLAANRACLLGEVGSHQHWHRMSLTLRELSLLDAVDEALQVLWVGIREGCAEHVEFYARSSKGNTEHERVWPVGTVWKATHPPKGELGIEHTKSLQEPRLHLSLTQLSGSSIVPHLCAPTCWPPWGLAARQGG